MDMDPSVIAKTAEQVAVGGYLMRQTAGVVGRLLGPSADSVSAVLAQWSSQRLENALRIGANAEAKAGRHRATGHVAPRIAMRVLDEGSWCHEEVMVEYLGGVLAGSRTPSGRDDRGLAWASLVTDMSSQQVRAHYLLYRAWTTLLRDRLDLHLETSEGRQLAKLTVDSTEFGHVMGTHADEVDLTHCVSGLQRLGLLAWRVSLGTDIRFDGEMVLESTLGGFELYGWAMGLPGLRPEQIYSLQTELMTDPPYPRLETAALQRSA